MTEAEYYLSKRWANNAPKIPLSRERFDQLEGAKIGIVAVVAIEEDWECVVRNFIEMEKEIAGVALDQMLSRISGYEEMQDMRLSFARRLANFLSAARSYEDRCARSHLAATGINNLIDDFAQMKTAEGANNFSYRFMRALRNFAQHNGLPLHGVTLDSSWIPGEETLKGQVRHRVTAKVDVAKLKADPEFSKTILRELSSGMASLNVIEQSRGYLEGLGKIHAKVRKSVQFSVDTWSSCLRTAMTEYEAMDNSSIVGLAAFEDRGEEALRYFDIFEDYIKRLELLKERNGTATNLARRFITTEL